MTFYSFETEYLKSCLQEEKSKPIDKQKHYRRRHDKTALCYNIGLEIDENDTEKLGLGDQENEILGRFVSENIDNIHWYQNRINKENRLRFTYAVFTVLILLAIPVLSAWFTLKASSFGFGTAETISSILTVLVTSVLGLHKLITSWMEKRRYRSLFFHAKVQLQNILFGLNEQFDKYESVSFEMRRTGQMNTAMYQALKDGIKNSRAVVNAETQEFFNLSSITTFNIGGVLSESAQTAKSLIGDFKAHSFDLDKKQQEHIQKEEQRKKTLVENHQKEIQLNAIVAKLHKQSAKQLELSQQINQLSQADQKKNAAEIAQLNGELDEVEETIENLETEFLQLKAEILPIEEDNY